MEENVERITIAEQAFDRIAAAHEQLNEALDAFDDVLDDLGLFSDYYGSPEWFDDHDADERGELPEDLKRGVLSEDAPYDALIELRSTALRMLEIATDTLYIV
ncbi:MAG: DUF4298 domain-containing protein [Atopobiaceae bacterium]|nr:DUF4298 domain-containing protein [Atopobiaceae bacterium]MBQ6521478.1 DUF4298 domain-containing protein [Atopobiaceae bacterium]MBQ9620815.1 DUF4298 domain-containing protein [Atopobiaceae bacterium]